MSLTTIVKQTGNWMKMMWIFVSNLISYSIGVIHLSVLQCWSSAKDAKALQTSRHHCQNFLLLLSLLSFMVSSLLLMAFIHQQAKIWTSDGLMPRWLKKPCSLSHEEEVAAYSTNDKVFGKLRIRTEGFVNHTHGIESILHPHAPTNLTINLSIRLLYTFLSTQSFYPMYLSS